MDDNARPSPTSHQLLRTLRRGPIGFLRLVREVLRQLGPALAARWRVASPVLRTVLQMLLALIIVFEEWGWQPLADLLGRLANWRPWAAVETAIARLPPYAALVVFVLPSTAPPAAQVPRRVPGREGPDPAGRLVVPSRPRWWRPL